jgi:hypothetical protein
MHMIWSPSSRVGLQECNRMLTYLREEAPIVVHFPLEELHVFLAADNQFRSHWQQERLETSIPSNASYLSGSEPARKLVDSENRMFNSFYESSADAERVKWVPSDQCFRFCVFSSLTYTTVTDTAS